LYGKEAGTAIGANDLVRDWQEHKDIPPEDCVLARLPIPQQNGQNNLPEPCLTCLTGSIVSTALALPYYADASRPARFIARFILASIFSLALTVLIAVVAFAIITALHHSVVRDGKRSWRNMYRHIAL
jgi:hypothetical protein